MARHRRYPCQRPPSSPRILALRRRPSLPSHHHRVRRRPRPLHSRPPPPPPPPPHPPPPVPSPLSRVRHRLPARRPLWAPRGLPGRSLRPILSVCSRAPSPLSPIPPNSPTAAVGAGCPACSIR